MFGPAAGMLGGTIPNIIRNYLEGDIDQATAMIARRIPVLNVFYLQLLSQLAKRGD